MPACADVCWRMLTYAGVCLQVSGHLALMQGAYAKARVLLRQAYELAQVCWRMLAYAGVCWRMLAYAGVCWRMLANADVC
jgi:hypothetical protein